MGRFALRYSRMTARAASRNGVAPARAAISAKNLPAASADPSTTDPQPRMPAATAPCRASGAAARVIRAAWTLGTSPCSAIATSVASSTRSWGAEGSEPVRSSQKCSLKPIRPTRSAARSRPRTTMVSALEVEMPDVRWSCRPIFTVPLSYVIFVYRKHCRYSK
jgi:hypothetical protein